MPEQTAKRIAYIDWVRGFACVVMFQTHCYDSWLGGAAREGQAIRWSQLWGTLPAPLFLFLAGISVALVTDKRREKGSLPRDIAHTTLRRGGEILLLALLFRIQEYALVWFRRPLSDLLRVDILNIIGVSLMLLGLACWAASGGRNPNAPRDLWRLRMRTIVVAAGACAAISVLTPLLWTTWQPHWRAWWLEAYINGVQALGTPQPWMFPIFPWGAFAFAGLAVGFLLLTDWSRKNQSLALTLSGFGGGALIWIGLWFDARPAQLYAVYDFWHTSPNFFLVRCGIVLLVLLAGYVWCRWGPGEWGYSPLIELGKSSLLVYWVHIELVYGVLSIFPKRSVGVPTATAGLVVIFVAMALLATANNRGLIRKAEISAFFRRKVATVWGQ